MQMPAGTKCTGGTSKNLCLASFVTTAGFGNCVAVSQGSSNDAAPPASNNSANDAATPPSVAKGKPQDNAAGNKTETAAGDKHKHKGDSAGSKAANATRRSANFKRNCEFFLDLAPVREVPMISQLTQGLLVNWLSFFNWSDIRSVMAVE